MSARSPRDAGFSLIEVMTSLAILIVVALSSTKVTVQMRKEFWSVQRKAKAMSIAEGFTEDLLLRASTDPWLAPGRHFKGLDRAGSETTTSPLYRVFWEVIPGVPKADMFLLRVRVEWPDEAKTEAIALVTARSVAP